MVPFSLPIIGHTISYIFNAEKFLAKCRNKYGDPFNIFIFGNVLTYVGNKTSCEVFKEHDIFDHEQVLVETLIFPLAFKRIKGFGNMRFLANAVHEQVSGKIKVYVPRMQKELKNGIDLYIGNCKESKVIKNFADTMLFIIVRPIFNIIFGEEASHFEELIISMTTLLKQLGTLPLIPPVLSIIHPSLHIKAISWFLRFGWNPINKPKKLFTKLMKPIVKKRLLQKKKLDNEYIKKEDLMEYYLFDSDYDPNNVNDEYMEFLFEQLIVTLFAAFFTTVKVVTEALYEYAGRPELWKDIFEEQIMIYNKSSGNLTIDDIHKMVKLDSLLKETLRHSFPVVLKTTMSNESYTFSTGAKIPKGRVVVVYAADSHFNSQVYNDPEIFQPNRYLTSNIDGSVVNYITATKLEKYYIPFGSGKHACPGRIFAVTEIKLCLYELILKYNIRTESGKVDPKLKIGDQLLPPITGLIFENR